MFMAMKSKRRYWNTVSDCDCLSLLVSVTILVEDVFIWGLIMATYQYLQLRQAEDKKLKRL